jgi:triacylglycerol lipase
MGGLDCRYLTSKLRPKAFKIRSVTTIGTPHRGSYFADYFLASLGKHRIPALASFLEYLPNGGGDGRAFEGLTLDTMKKFNEDVPDVEGVEYFRYVDLAFTSSWFWASPRSICGPRFYLFPPGFI